MPPKLEDLNNRFDALESENLKQRDTWIEIAKYTNPSMTLRFDGEDTDGKQYAKDVYDTTAIDAVKTFTDGIVGNYVSKSALWMGMMAVDPEVNRKKDVQEFLQDVTQRVFAALSRSNFYNMISQYTTLGITIATATMYVQEDPRTGQIVFSVRHPSEIFIDQDWYGKIDTCFRRIIVTAKAAGDFFFNEKSKFSEGLTKAINDDPFQKFTFRHGVFPAKGEYFKYPGVTGNHASIYWEEGEDRELSVGGYDTFPFVSWRYRQEGNEIYGRGPSHDALPDIKNVNAMKLDIMKYSQKQGDPPLNIPYEMKGKVRNKPGGANYYQDPGRIVFPWSSASNIPVTLEQLKDMRKQVEDHYYVPYFKMLTGLTQRMTSFEVSERKSEQATLISTPIIKYESEALDELLFRVFEIESAAGRMPDIPGDLQGEVTWQYNGQLAQVQIRTARNHGVYATISDLERIAQFAPQVVQTFNWDATVRELALNNGFPARNLLTEQEVEKKLAEQKQLQDQQNQLAAAESMGKAMPGLNQEIVEGSPAEALL
jgi:hypothetical protein